MRALRFILTASVIAVAFAAAASPLDDYKRQGAIGEKGDGYVAVVSPAPGAEAFAREINAKRRAEYQKIAAGNGQSLAVVEQLAGKKLLERTEPGEYYYSGGWVKK